MSTKPSPPIPIRLSPALLEKIQLAADLMGRTQQEVMRLAMEVGLEDLKRCNYDLAAAIVDAARADKPKPPISEPVVTHRPRGMREILAAGKGAQPTSVIGAVFTDEPAQYGKSKKSKA